MIHLATSLARHLPGLSETRPDAELLAAFRSDRDEVAFAELVRRHGPLVWSACRRLLPDPADAEDAFQATFLVLVRRAHRLAGHPTLGPWLYQVAVWTSRNMRRRNARILSRRLPRMPDVADPSPGPQAFDLRADLDEALLALPEKYRSALVLCHLQGWSRREAAARLGCPEGTLSSLLARGLDRLRVKLKGLDPTQALAIGVGSVPLVLASATVKAATGFHLAAACAATSTATLLAEGVLRMFWIKKATAASFALIAVFGFGMGIGVSVHQMPGAAAGEGPEVVAGGPGAEASVVDDLFQRKLELLKRKLAAAKSLEASAAEGVKMSKRKVEATQKASENGTGSSADLLQDRITLTRFEENLAQAQQAIVQIEIEIAELLATRKPADESTQKSLAKLQRQVAYARAAEKSAREALRLSKDDPNVLPRVKEEVANASQHLVKVEADLAEFLVAQKIAKAAAEGETLFADGPVAEKTSAEDELFQRKLELLKRKLAAAKEVEKSAVEGVRLTRKKAEQSKEASESGTGTSANLLQDRITLTRFEENLAQAQLAIVQIEIEIAELLATRRPAGNQFEVIKLKNVKAEDAVTVLHELFNGPKKDENRVRIVAEKTSNSLIIVKASPADLLTIRKLLENMIDADKPDDKNLRRKIDENEKLIQELKSQQEMLRAKELQLLADLLRLGKSSDLLLRPNTPPEKPLPDSIRGTVTAYKDGYVSLSIGIDAGLTPGATLDIWREEGMQWLGSVVVERVYPKEAVATFKPADSRRAISKLIAKELPVKGDIVGKLGDRLKLKASDIAAKGYLDLVLAKPGDTWAFSIREVGPENKVAGTVHFENFEVLKRFLARIGAEVGGPKTVYITGPADAKNESIQAILDACKAAGLHVLAQRYVSQPSQKK